MKTAAFIGIPLSEFYRMTPKEFSIYVEGFNERKEIETKEQITIAYANALWTIQWLGKKSDHPKALEEILGNIEAVREKKVMSDIDMLNQVKVLNALFGGEVKTCNS